MVRKVFVDDHNEARCTKVACNKSGKLNLLLTGKWVESELAWTVAADEMCSIWSVAATVQSSGGQIKWSDAAVVSGHKTGTRPLSADTRCFVATGGGRFPRGQLHVCTFNGSLQPEKD